ncbi:hypothetical protein D3C78_1449140 [compost metagenome]
MADIDHFVYNIFDRVRELCEIASLYVQPLSRHDIFQKHHCEALPIKAKLQLTRCFMKKRRLAKMRLEQPLQEQLARLRPMKLKQLAQLLLFLRMLFLQLYFIRNALDHLSDLIDGRGLGQVIRYT